jgi:hypothetical protein
MDLSSPQNLLIFGIKILLAIMTIGLFIYALLVLREVSIMNSNLKTRLAPFIGILTFLHFIVAILVVILLVVILLAA